jgi:hypothetical protein
LHLINHSIFFNKTKTQIFHARSTVPEKCKPAEYARNQLQSRNGSRNLPSPHLRHHATVWKNEFVYFVIQHPMTHIHIVEIISQLDSGLKSAMRVTLIRHFPDQQYNSDAVFGTFKRMDSRKCDYWIKVPDNQVIKQLSSRFLYISMHLYSALIGLSWGIALFTLTITNGIKHSLSSTELCNFASHVSQARSYPQ